MLLAVFKRNRMTEWANQSLRRCEQNVAKPKPRDGSGCGEGAALEVGRVRLQHNGLQEKEHRPLDVGLLRCVA